MSKVIRDCNGFTLTMLCDWPRKLAPPSQPIRCKTETNRDFFTRVFPRLRPVTCVLSSRWLLLIFSFVLIGRCGYFGFGITTLNQKAFYYNVQNLCNHECFLSARDLKTSSEFELIASTISAINYENATLLRQLFIFSDQS